MPIWAELLRDLRSRMRPTEARDCWMSSKFKHWLATAVFNAVYVSRSQVEDQDSLEPLVEAPRNSSSPGIFLEGARSNKGEPQSFKSGLFNLAKHLPGMQEAR